MKSRILKLFAFLVAIAPFSAGAETEDPEPSAPVEPAAAVPSAATVPKEVSPKPEELPTFADSVERLEKVGRVVEVGDGYVLVARNEGSPVARGKNVAFLNARGDEDVVGEVTRVNNTTYEVTIRMNEEVRLGEIAYKTQSESTGSLVAPQPADYQAALGLMARPWLGLGGQRSGLLLSAFGTVNLGKRVRLRAAVEPFAPGLGVPTNVPRSSTPGVLEAFVAPTVHFRLLEIGFGFGVGTANHTYESSPRYGFLLTPVLRIGAEDGLMLRIRSSAVVARVPVFGSFSAYLEAPIVFGVKALVAGGGGDSGYFFVETGVKKLVVGNGGSGSWLATVTLGLAGTSAEYGPFAGEYGGEVYYSQNASGPYMGLGVERRF